MILNDKTDIVPDVDQVYVIDDDVSVRRSLYFLLATAGFLSWPFASASDFLDNLPTLVPAPILLDVRMPHIDGIELMALLSDQGIKWPVIVLTAYADISIAVQATKLGAVEFLEKPCDFDMLEKSLRSAKLQLSIITNAEEAKSRSSKLFGLLSQREIEVMAALADGLSNKAAAHRLSISVRTVEMHRANALNKLNVRSVAEVLRLANEAGLRLDDRT